MSEIWNPWHGCHKLSPGCANCYVYRRDESIGKDASVVTKTGDYDLPLKKNRQGQYKLTADNGVMTITGECAVYPLAEGNVESVYESDGKYAVTVFHSDNFKSVITGLDMSYVSLGDKIYAGIPVGYVREKAKVAMYDGDRLITNYSLLGGSIVWES